MCDGAVTPAFEIVWGRRGPRHRMVRDFHVQEIHVLKLDSASGQFDWELRYDPDASQVGAGTVLESALAHTNNTTGVTHLPPFDPGDPAIIPAGDWLWLELANVTTGIFRPVMALVFAIGVEKGA